MSLFPWSTFVPVTGLEKEEPPWVYLPSSGISHTEGWYGNELPVDESSLGMCLDGERFVYKEVFMEGRTLWKKPELKYRGRDQASDKYTYS